MRDDSLPHPDGSNAIASGGFRRYFNAILPEIDNRDDAEFLRGMLLLGGVLFVLTLLTYVLTTSWTWPFPRDNTTLVVGRDFLNLWMYGRAVITESDPARFYDIAIYNQELAKLLGPGYFGQNWPNPPTALVAMAPFGLLNYFPALFAWFATGLIALCLAGRRDLADIRILAVVLMSPAALLCLISGQSSLLTTAALLAIFALLDRRPLLAGILIGLLTIKPQLGFLFPIALIASGRWRVFLAAAVTALALIAISIAVGGQDVWYAYVLKALPLQREVLSDAAGTAVPFHPTVFMNVRGLLGNSIADIVQILFTVAAVAAVALAFRFRSGGDQKMLRALFFACTVSASP